MLYQGSKNRIAKLLLPHMIPHRGHLPWVEPFVGGANMIAKVSGRRWGNELNYYQASLLAAISEGWVPPEEVSYTQYQEVKAHPDRYPPALVAFIGIQCSFGGKWWGGYARNKDGRNYAKVARNNILKQANFLKGVFFTYGDYRELQITEKSLIYCDPPYAGTLGYSGEQFDSKSFWLWATAQATAGHLVFVSEYTAPIFTHIELLDAIPFGTTMNKNIKEDKRTEKLYRVHPT